MIWRAKLAPRQRHGDLRATALFFAQPTEENRMGKTLSQTPRARASAVALALLACLVVAGCAPHDRRSDEDNRSGGFYGGISAGKGL
jgi:hypothetical protein